MIMDFKDLRRQWSAMLRVGEGGGGVREAV